MVDHLLKDYNIQREDRNDDVEADVFPLETRYERYESNEIRRYGAQYSCTVVVN